MYGTKDWTTWKPQKNGDDNALECIAGSVFYIAPVVLIKLSFIVRRYSKTINQVMVASVNISKGQPQLYHLQPILLRMSGYEMLALEYQKSITKILNWKSNLERGSS